MVKQKFIVSYILVILLVSLQQYAWSHKIESDQMVTIAILAKDKAHCLPLYLYCLEQQTWPKSKTNIYIRTNNNNDNTREILKDWVEQVKDQYAEIYFDDTNVADKVERYKPHEWNAIRFKVLGTIRNESIQWAYNKNSHYFVADCDNFIVPDTIESLLRTNRSIVAPLLVCYSNNCYSNYHDAINQWGYLEQSPLYFPILHQKIKGIIQLPVVHCTYFIQHSVLNKLTYQDNTQRHEYIVFSESARKQNIGQYLDNRQTYGFLTFANTQTEFNDYLSQVLEIIKSHKKTTAFEQQIVAMLKESKNN